MGSVSITPQALGRVAIRETLGRRIRNAREEADKWQRIGELASLRTKSKGWLQPADFERFARTINADPAVVHAVADSETGQGADGKFQAGFDENGRGIILAEPHIFSALTFHAYDVKLPQLSYPTWTPYKRDAKPPGAFDRHPYTYNQNERWQLVLTWAEFNFEAAVGAMSFGRFQQLIGSRRASEGWKMLGFDNGWHLLTTLAQSEFAQLEIFHRYLDINGLIPALRRLDWRAIARGYNGGGQVAHYAGRMAAFYAQRRKQYA